MSEADTKANFIDQYLSCLGYDNFEDIEREHFISNSRDFLDYLIKLNGHSTLAVEAKPLRDDLNDKMAAQLIQYCSIEGIEWCVLSNGREWRVYNQFLKGGLENKFCCLHQFSSIRKR